MYLEIILHIGINKTGTSSLQKFLELNPQNLAREGWVYPQAGRMDAAHHGLAQAVANSVGAAREMVGEMLAEAGKEHRLIISSEALHDTPHVGRLAEAFSGHDVKVVIFLRDYIDYLSSWYRQDVQAGGLCCDFENYAVLKRKMFLPLLRRWAQHFDKKNLHIRDYDRKTLRNGSSVDEVMLDIVGLESIDGWNTVGYENNPSVSGNLLFFKRLVNNFCSREEASQFTDQITDLAKIDESFRARMHVRSEFGAYIFATQFEKDVVMIENEFGFSLRARGGGREGAMIPDHDRLQADYAAILAECDRRGFSFGAELRKYAPRFLKD